MTADRISGRLVQSYSYVTPAEPGWAQPRVHRGDGTAPTDRDNAPAGGGWQPKEWTDPTVVKVLDGDSQPHEQPSDHRRRDDRHRGIMRRGAAVDRHALDSLDRFQGGPSGTAPILGAGGANNGGLRAEGSAPWMSPGASRRRADGGVVSRAPGFRPGYRYVVNTQEHRQGLHMNKPTIRGVREKIVTKSVEKSLRTSGPLAPSSRTIIPPYSTPAATVRVEPAAPSVIGGGWVM